jgi:hypothetical protein
MGDVKKTLATQNLDCVSLLWQQKDFTTGVDRGNIEKCKKNIRKCASPRGARNNTTLPEGSARTKRFETFYVSFE